MELNTTLFLLFTLILAFIISILIIRLYQKTHLVDYLILLGVIGLQFIAGALNPVTLDNKSIRLLQIRESILVWAFYLLFLHAIRVIKNPESQDYRLFNIGILLYTMFLQLLIIFWRVNEQESITNFGIEFKVDPNYLGEGA